jgi:catechol 2,3-dioxygenase-like lactoylglutathione lyase family enzyme
MTQNIHAFTIVVPDYDIAISYYCDVLGFELTEDTPQGGDKRWVMVRPKGTIGTNILLARAVGETQTASIGNQTGGRVFVFLHTDDFDRDYQNYQANGVDFIETPRNEPYGKVCKFPDTFGNLWDLLERSQTV